MNRNHIASELLLAAKEVTAAETKIIGGVEFEAVKKKNPRTSGSYWVYKVGRKEFADQGYTSKNQMWDDLERANKSYGDDERWERDFT